MGMRPGCHDSRTNERMNETNERKSKAQQFERKRDHPSRQTVLGSEDRPRGSLLSLADLRAPLVTLWCMRARTWVCGCARGPTVNARVTGQSLKRPISPGASRPTDGSLSPKWHKLPPEH